ncbi:MAG: hypothetical protein QF552_10935 [Litorilituus sp.]|jgi:hypothetical protein|nr:hypothetical protein [Litorilituus sp.]
MAHHFITQLLRKKIRFAQEPNNPALITLWLQQENDIHLTTQPKKVLRQHYEAQFRLLLETIVDEIVPTHWRRLCLDNIYKPITSLQRIADTEQSKQHIRYLMNELSVSCQYVEHSL